MNTRFLTKDSDFSHRVSLVNSEWLRSIHLPRACIRYLCVLRQAHGSTEALVAGRKYHSQSPQDIQVMSPSSVGRRAKTSSEMQAASEPRVIIALSRSCREGRVIILSKQKVLVRPSGTKPHNNQLTRFYGATCSNRFTQGLGRHNDGRAQQRTSFSEY